MDKAAGDTQGIRNLANGAAMGAQRANSRFSLSRGLGGHRRKSLILLLRAETVSDVSNKWGIVDIRSAHTF